MRLITLQQLRSKIGGRSRNAIFEDIERGRLPRPRKFGDAPGSKNYWVEEEVERSIATIREAPETSQVEGRRR